MFSFVRSCYTVFQSSWTTLHSHQECTRVQFLRSFTSTWYCLSGFLSPPIGLHSLSFSEPKSPPVHASHSPRLSHPLCSASQAWCRPVAWVASGETWRLLGSTCFGDLAWDGISNAAFQLSEADKLGAFLESLAPTGPIIFVVFMLMATFYLLRSLLRCHLLREAYPDQQGQARHCGAWSLPNFWECSLEKRI